MEIDLRALLKWATSTALACLSFVGWVLALVNTSLIHEDCGSRERCDNFLRRFWWSLMFQAGIMVVVFFIWVGGGVAKARTGIIGFLALVTVQHIELVGRLMTALDDTAEWPVNDDDIVADEWLDDDVVRGDISGFTLLSFTNMVYMLFVGIAMQETTPRGTTPAEPEKKEEAPAEETSPV